MTEMASESKIAYSNIAESKEYPSYEVREYYYSHFMWLAIMMLINAILNFFTIPKTIKLVIIGCWVLVAVLVIIRVFRKGKLMRLTLYSDRFTIDDTPIHAAELKSVNWYWASGHIDFVNKEGPRLARIKRVQLNHKKDKSDLQRQIKMFCEQNNISFKYY